MERNLIFDSDQGSKFACKDLTQILLDKGIKISIDGRVLLIMYLSKDFGEA